jgi:hypothetical protein
LFHCQQHQTHFLHAINGSTMCGCYTRGFWLTWTQPLSVRIAQAHMKSAGADGWG